MAATESKSQRIGTEAVLLALDPQHFPGLTGARQVLVQGTPHPANPILRPRLGQWDGTRCKVYGTVLVDPADGLFKMWYSGGTDTPDSVRRESGSPRNLGYAWSTDGVHWERPSLGLVRYNGSTDNNLILLDAQAPSVFLFDDAPDPAQRFLMFTSAGQVTNDTQLLHSADGVHWVAHEKPPADCGDWGKKTHEPFSILYDPRDPDPSRRWKGYSLLHLFENGYRGRAVGCFVGPRFDHWVEHEVQPLMSAFDGLESEIHIPHVSRMHDTYIMLYDAMEPNHHTQTEVAVSDDGVNFRRVQNGVKLIPNGAPGEVDAGKVCVSPRSLFVHHGKIWWYYTVSPDTYQTTPRALYAAPWYRYTNLLQWREDGFARIELASAGKAEVTSAPLKVEREIGRVWLNASTARGDGILVELLDHAGSVVATSRPWKGDELRGEVQWTSPPKLKAPAQRVQLRLSFGDASTHIYAAGVVGAVRDRGDPMPVHSPPRQRDKRSRWQFKAGKFSGGAAAWKDLVLAGSWDQHLYALDARSGEVRWKFQADNVIAATPRVHDDAVYFGARDGNVYALDAVTGRLRWKSPVHDGKKFNAFNPNGTWVDASPVVGPYTCKWNPPVFDTKTSVWKREQEPAAPAWLFIGSHDRQMHAFDPKTGNEMWRHPTFNWIISPAVVENYTVYFASMDGHIYAVDAQCGALKWRFRIGADLKYAPVVVPGSVACEASCGHPLVAGGTVYCGADDGCMYALDAATGQQQWATRTGKWIWGRPALFEQTLVVASADAIVYGFDANSGRTNWRRALPNANYADVVQRGDLSLISCTNGVVYALRSVNGEVAWSYQADGPIRSEPCIADGGVCVITTTAGTVEAFEP